MLPQSVFMNPRTAFAGAGACEEDEGVVASEVTPSAPADREEGLGATGGIDGGGGNSREK